MTSFHISPHTLFARRITSLPQTSRFLQPRRYQSSHSHDHHAPAHHHENEEPEYRLVVGADAWIRVMTIFGLGVAFYAQHQYFTSPGEDGVYRSHPYTTWMRTVPMTEQRKRERLLEELRRIDDRAESLILFKNNQDDLIRADIRSIEEKRARARTHVVNVGYGSAGKKKKEELE